MIQKRNTYHTPEGWTLGFRQPWQDKRLSRYYGNHGPEIAQVISFYEEDLHLWEQNEEARIDAQFGYSLVDDVQQHDFRDNPELYLTPAGLAEHKYCGFGDPDGCLTTRAPGDPHALPTDPASWNSDPSNVNTGVYNEVEPVFYDLFGVRIAS